MQEYVLTPSTDFPLPLIKPSSRLSYTFPLREDPLSDKSTENLSPFNLAHAKSFCRNL